MSKEDSNISEQNIILDKKDLPNKDVLQAFGVFGDPTLLAGG